MSATCLSVSRGRGFHLSLRFNLKGTFEDCLIIIIIIIMTPQALAGRRDVRSRVPGGLPNPYLTMAISEPQQERGSGADGSGADLVPELPLLWNTPGMYFSSLRYGCGRWNQVRWLRWNQVRWLRHVLVL